MLHLEYTCPRCGNEWTDDYECAVDDDCGACGLRHISPDGVTDLNDDDETE